jgi:hypothetical protein
VGSGGGFVVVGGFVLGVGGFDGVCGKCTVSRLVVVCSDMCSSESGLLYIVGVLRFGFLVCRGRVVVK